MVLENTVLFGSVNAGRHYQQVADAVAKADIDWLERMLTRQARWMVSPPRWIRARTTSKSST